MRWIHIIGFLDSSPDVPIPGVIKTLWAANNAIIKNKPGRTKKGNLGFGSAKPFQIAMSVQLF
jgi:hypothetical protein